MEILSVVLCAHHILHILPSLSPPSHPLPSPPHRRARAPPSPLPFFPVLRPLCSH
ncbi:hypothetical protein CsSME_00030093 [Camellia sinensis var. sinensis]